LKVERLPGEAEQVIVPADEEAVSNRHRRGDDVFAHRIFAQQLKLFPDPRREYDAILTRGVEHAVRNHGGRSKRARPPASWQIKRLRVTDLSSVSGNAPIAEIAEGVTSIPSPHRCFFRVTFILPVHPAWVLTGGHHLTGRGMIADFGFAGWG
jgi:hypothetical protein